MRRSLAVLLALVLLGAACGSDDDTSNASSDSSESTEDTTAPAGGDYGGGAAKKPAGSTGSAITAKDFAFAPAAIDVKVGATVTVTNEDGAAHTWTADDGSFDEELGAGAEATHTFDEAGTFSYHCEIHPSMTGTVEVS